MNSLCSREIISSLKQASNSAGRWIWAVLYSTASDMYSDKVGGMLQRWKHELIFIGRREFDIRKSHKSRWANEICLSLWLLSARKALANHRAQYSDVGSSLKLIHVNRVIYVNSLTGIKGVIYLHAHLQDQALSAHSGFHCPAHCCLNLMWIKENEEKHTVTWQECCRMVKNVIGLNYTRAIKISFVYGEVQRPIVLSIDQSIEHLIQNVQLKAGGKC